MLERAVTGSAVRHPRALGGLLLETVISAATLVLALIGVVHLVAMAWWAIALPLSNSEVSRQVLSQMSLVQLAIDPPEVGVLTPVEAFGVDASSQAHASRWLLPAAPESWVATELFEKRLRYRCLLLKDRRGFMQLGCRADWQTPFGWALSRSDWISQRPGGTVDRFEGEFFKTPPS